MNYKNYKKKKNNSVLISHKFNEDQKINNENINFLIKK